MRNLDEAFDLLDLWFAPVDQWLLDWVPPILWPATLWVERCLHIVLALLLGVVGLALFVPRRLRK